MMVYYGSPIKNFESIKKNGLVPDKYDKKIYFGANEKQAIAAAPGGVLFRVKKSNISKLNQLDVPSSGNRIFDTNNIIRPKFLEYSKDNGKTWFGTI